MCGIRDAWRGNWPFDQVKSWSVGRSTPAIVLRCIKQEQQHYFEGEDIEEIGGSVLGIVWAEIVALAGSSDERGVGWMVYLDIN